MCAWKGLARLPCLKHFSIQIRRPCTSKIGSNACNTSVISWNMISTLIYCLQYFWTLLFGFFEPLSRNARNNCILCITMPYEKAWSWKSLFFARPQTSRWETLGEHWPSQPLLLSHFSGQSLERQKCSVSNNRIGSGMVCVGVRCWMVRSSVFLSPSSTPEAFENSWIISAAK